MLFLGHIAATLLVAEASRSDRNAAVAGNLLPDVMDKSGGLLHLMPHTRWLAHGLPFFVLASVLSGLFLPPRAWRGFVFGYAGHLVCDLWAGGKVPWLAPFEKPRPHGPGKPLRWWLLYLLPEAVGAPIIWLLARRSLAGASPDPAATRR